MYQFLKIDDRTSLTSNISAEQASEILREIVRCNTEILAVNQRLIELLTMPVYQVESIPPSIPQD